LLGQKKLHVTFFLLFLGFFVCIEKAEKQSYNQLLAPAYFVAEWMSLLE